MRKENHLPNSWKTQSYLHSLSLQEVLPALSNLSIKYSSHVYVPTDSIRISLIRAFPSFYNWSDYLSVVPSSL